MANLLPWQLFSDQGIPIKNHAALPKDIFSKNLLHAAAHIWVWRESPNGPEIMLQKRSAQVKNFPGLLDISAAGHIDIDEDPLQTAVREIREEIGLTIKADDLRLAGVSRVFMPITSGHNKGRFENEFRFVYLLKMNGHQETNFVDGEVHSVIWKSIADMQTDLFGAKKKLYVPHPPAYFAMLFAALDDYQAAATARQQAA